MRTGTGGYSPGGTQLHLAERSYTVGERICPSEQYSGLCKLGKAHKRFTGGSSIAGPIRYIISIYLYVPTRLVVRAK